MKKALALSATAAVAVLALSAGSAFADLSFVGGQNIPNSFQLDFTAVVNAGQTATAAFDRFTVTVLGNVSYTVSSGSYVITSPQLLEEFAPTHNQIGLFDHFENGNVLSHGTDGWVQTAIPANGTNTSASAQGNPVPGVINSGNSNRLSFSVFFAGTISQGTHFQIVFFNGTAPITGYEVKYQVGNQAGVTTAEGYEQTNFAVPLPSAAWMGLAMFGGLGAFMAKRRRDRQILA